MKNQKTTILTMLLVFIFIGTGFAQYATKKIRTKHEAYTDSLKQVDYKFVFPILGKGAYKKGFDIPYPAGVMANYIYMKQNIIVENLKLGFKNGDTDIPLTPTDFIGFGENTSTAWGYNVRADLWVLPFFNVYGIYGNSTSRTEINIVKPISLNSVVEQNVRTSGFGALLAAGLGPIFISADFNWTWSKPEYLDKSVMVNVMGLRAGHVFTFKNNPKSNIGVWIGTMNIGIAADTKGELALKEALPVDFWDKKDQFVENYDAWYDGLSIAEKLLADKVLTPLVDAIDNIQEDATVRYGLEKRPQETWSGLVGAQYQINKRWMIRTEASVLGNRKSILGSVNYRFLI
ncbi:hypothetical protein EC396_16570 [Lutibacter sp. HS1-25]|uniref:hypothetical protein n=1 Tax=Lutibacter sp. HS1-25 TaxID=2485000 RepID=UPI001010D338|nr:hypothetical protein [Lutibacter sp. HS1-25]RXP44775.1 hypothetical protein EC396_16570 [Lutibacter sp. HS1-25]